MLKLIFVIAFTTAAFGQGLCPGSNSAPEKDGILGGLQQIEKLLPPADAGAKLVAIDLSSSTGLCQWEMLSSDGRTRLIFINGPVPMQLSTKVAADGTQRPLPDGLIDLPQAIAAAERQGMRMPLDSARLRMAQPRGKPAVAVWTLSPKNNLPRFLSYFIAAADPGRPLKLSDVTDYFADYNAQWQYIVDAFHTAQATGAQQQQSNSLVGQPCIVRYTAGGNGFHDPRFTIGTRRGQWTMMSNGLTCW